MNTRMQIVLARVDARRLRNNMKAQVATGKFKSKKGGYVGDKMWKTHRLEGSVKNRAIKPIKKKRKTKP